MSDGRGVGVLLDGLSPVGQWLLLIAAAGIGVGVVVWLVLAGWRLFVRLVSDGVDLGDYNYGPHHNDDLDNSADWRRL